MPQAYTPGNEADFDRLYRDSYSRLLATLVPLLQDRAAAEDCVQDAFVRAYKAWPKWKPDAPAEAWLHRIAVNLAANERRRRRLREVGELVRRLGAPPPAPDPARSVEQADVVQALRRLPPKLAAAVVLRHLHGYSNRDIATAVGIPESTVGSRLRLALKRLRRELGADWQAEVATSPLLDVSPVDG